MSATTTSERRIAHNTVLLMVRMALLMVLNLAAVRFVRSGLGMEDYGVLNAVTGVVQLLTCLNAVLAISCQRYLSMAMGAKDETRLKDYFHVSVHLSRGGALLVVLVMETVGLWFVATQMNYPAERFGAVMIIYQAAIFTLVSLLLQVPYLAAIMAHERMNIFAWVTILEGMLKFALALSLAYCPCDRMALYGTGLLVASVISTALYWLYVKRHFSESHNHLISNRCLYREMLGFTGWTLYGSLAGAMMLQGNMVLLNVHVGPLANAAFAVALMLYNALSQFGNNVITAAKPQMVMRYSQGDRHGVNRLFWLTNIALLGGLGIVLIPLEIWMPQILQLWLGDADSMTIDFCRLMLVASAALLLSAPITTILQAAGRVREYHLLVETITILSLPLAYVLLLRGSNPACVCWSIIICITLAHLFRIERLWRFYIRKQTCKK